MVKKILLATILLSQMMFAKGALVEVTALTKGEVNPLEEFIGNVKFAKKSLLAAQNAGMVKKINFEVGEKVKKADVLLEIDSDLLQAQINAAKANLQNAKNTLNNSQKDYERYKKLLASKTITQKEYDDIFLKNSSSQSNVKVLEAKLKELEIKLQKKKIKAPFSGVIIEKNINLAEWLNPGSPVAKIVDTSKLEFIFNIPLNVVNGLKVGTIYNISLSNKTIKAKLDSIIPNGDKLTRTFPVKFKANLRNTFVFEGQEVKAKLSQNAKKQAFILPRDAVIKRFGQNVIFIVDKKSMVNMMPVQIVGFVGTKVAIKAKGLVKGMSIVSKGNERIFPNMPVTIINKK